MSYCVMNLNLSRNLIYVNIYIYIYITFTKIAIYILHVGAAEFIGYLETITMPLRCAALSPGGSIRENVLANYRRHRK